MVKESTLFLFGIASKQVKALQTKRGRVVMKLTPALKRLLPMKRFAGLSCRVSIFILVRMLNLTTETLYDDPDHFICCRRGFQD